MAKLKVYSFPDMVLTQKATPIERVDKSLYRLADDMLETMYAEIGVGLAANQVGILQRILVIDAEFDLEELPEGVPPPQGVEVVDRYLIKNKNPQIVINPEITYREGNILQNEACLSVPNFHAKVNRAEKIKITFQTIDGLTKTIAADGLFAHALQHEIDHLDGRLFIDRLSSLKREMVKKKLLQERAKRGAIGGDDESDDFVPGPSKKKKGL